MSEDQKELAKVIEKYFGADAGYLDIDCFTLARRIIEAGWIKPVRCKDCKYCIELYDSVIDESAVCGMGMFRHFKPDDFCSCGERRN